jgi:hypothetical protein
VLKVFHPAEDPAARVNQPTSWAYWCREALLYRSGLLADLPGELRAPRCAGVIGTDDGSLQLWLEFVRDDAPGDWTFEQHARTAQHLGAMNGAYLDRALPDLAGLSRRCLRSWVGRMRELIAERTAAGMFDRPEVQATVRSLERVRALERDAEALLDAIERLPQTFCHLDGWRENMLASGAGTVAIEWMFSGIAAIGEDPAAVLGADLWHFLVAPDRAGLFDEAIYSAYVSGLREAGWHGDERLVRFVHAGAVALRLGLLIPVWAPRLTQADEREWLERKFGRPLAAISEGWAEVLEFLLGRADEARDLGQVLGLL